MHPRFVAENLLWAGDGTVWAVWRVRAETYLHLDHRAKLRLHARTREALLELPDEAMLLGVCAPLDPTDFVARLTGSTDLEQHPEWAAAVADVLEEFAELTPFERFHFVAARLPNAPHSFSALRLTVGAAAGRVAGAFGVPSLPPPEAEIAARHDQATSLLKGLQGRLDGVISATADEIEWLHRRAPRRGIDDLPLPACEERRVDRSASTARRVVFDDVLFHEGGHRSDPSRPRTHRRYLRAETETGVAYQTFLVLAAMPHRFVLPGGGEWCPATEGFSFPIDWCVRFRKVPNARAQAKAGRQARALAAQCDEYEGEAAGVPASLLEAHEGLDDERAALAANPSDPEFETSIILSVAADDLGTLEELAEEVRRSFAVREYHLPRPTGGQFDLFRAVLPGAPLPRVARDYTQYLLARDVAAGMPFAGVDVGDPSGILVGLSLDGGSARPVFVDPAYGPANNMSGSLGAVGDLGSGKSYFAKCLAWGTLARGGQVVTLDRTPRGEWVQFAGVAPGSPQVVRLDPSADEPATLDPLRVFSGDERITVATGFLSLLTGSTVQSLEGAALARAVRQVAGRSDPHLGGVLEELSSTAASNPAAEKAARTLEAVAELPLARIAFGDGPVLRLGDADFVVFHAPSLALPDRETALSERLARQMSLEEILGRALLYLVAAVARRLAFADVSRFAVLLIEEAWVLTSSLEGERLIREAVKDGRKHASATWLFLQHPEDLADPVIRDLLRNRFVFRQSRGAAAQSLAFLGVEATREAIDLVEVGLGTGECLFRDVRDRIGLIHVLRAARPDLHEAFDTRPTVGTFGEAS